VTPWLLFAAAAGLGLAATWAARQLAGRAGLVDKPDGRRKIHAHPVAVTGGLAVLAATVAALAVGAAVSPDIAGPLRENAPRAAALLAAMALIAAVGVVDDAVNLRARYKLAGQLAAILVLVGPGGFVIEQITLGGVLIPFGPLAVPLTVVWFLAAVNAVNLLDGMDGLLGTIGVIVASSLAVMAFAVGNPFPGLVAAALAGALVGFLRFNWPPATVYLGDCGSMLIGLTVAALAIAASLKGPAVAIAGPVALLALPFLDTTAAVVRRKLTGRGLAIADRGHLHHVLQRHGMSRPRVLALVAALGCVAAAGAIAGVVYGQDALAAVAAVAVVFILIAGGLFGTAEVRLIRERMAGAYRSAVNKNGHVELSVRLQGTADWAVVWQRLVRSADELALRSMRLDVNAPAWHEGFHGRWDKTAPAAAEFDVWRLELPVFGRGTVIGRLAVAGVRTDTPMADLLARISGVLADAEMMAGEITPPPVPGPLPAAPARPLPARVTA
jgi:UDP-GlcNAc:undecaprenyl-phosphate GlcNAc-1-phosphate transferase